MGSQNANAKSNDRSHELNNYYEILEVSPNASAREIQEAYKRAKATYGSDNPALYSMFTREEAKQLMNLVEEAFAVLGSASSREHYNQRFNDEPEVKENVFSEIQAPSFAVPAADAVPYRAEEAGHWVFEAPALIDEGSGRVKVRAKSSGTNGKTQFGNYTIDPAVEAQILSASEFDGAFLQQVRLYKNLTLENVSSATRISRTYLTAVENMDIKALPAPVFIRGFVSQMARVLGVEEKKAADSYMKILAARFPQAFLT